MKLHIVVPLVIFLVPLTAATAPLPPSKSGVWMGRIDENGSMQFREIDAPGTVRGVFPTVAGGYAMVGIRDNRTGAWVRTIGGHNQSADPVLFAPAARSIDVTTQGDDGVMFLAGEAEAASQDTVWAAALKPNGEPIFQRVYPEPAYVFTDAVAGRSGYTVVGYQHHDGQPAGGLFLRVSRAGDLKRRRVIGGNGDKLASIFDAADGYWVTGSRPSTGSSSWVLRLNATGNVLWRGLYGAEETHRLESTVVHDTAENSIILLEMPAEGMISVEKREADAELAYRSQVYSAPPDGEVAAQDITETGDGFRILLTNTTRQTGQGLREERTDYMLFSVAERRSTAADPATSLLTVFDWPDAVHNVLSQGNASVVIGMNHSDPLLGPGTTTLQLQRIGEKGATLDAYRVESQSLVKRINALPPPDRVRSYESFTISPIRVLPTGDGYTVFGRYSITYNAVDRKEQTGSSGEERQSPGTKEEGVLDLLVDWLQSIVSSVSGVVSRFR